MLWDGSVDDWNTGGHLSKAARQAGLSPDDLERDISIDQASLDAELERNDASLRAAGYWGVPTMLFDGEPFFGQDRFDVLVWRLQQHGLTPRQKL